VFGEASWAPAAGRGPAVDAVLDLGANVGLSMRVWQAAFPDARIIGVEPDAGSLAVAGENVRRGVRPERVSLVHGAIAARSGVCYLERNRGGAWASRASPRPAVGAEAVAGYSVPDLLARHGVGSRDMLVKCDVEGAERELFASCASWIGRVARLAVEVHEPYTAADLLEALDRSGARMRVTATQAGQETTCVFLAREGAKRAPAGRGAP